MQFQVLGTLRAVSAGEEVFIASAPKARLVLALLVSRGGQVVSVDSLVDALWRDRPPASALQNIHQYVHRLRGTLGAEVIRGGSGGYWLNGGEDSDAHQFSRLAADGRAALAGGDADGAGVTLRDALDLWRGPAYAEFADYEAVAAEAQRLERLRVDVYEWWVRSHLVSRRYAVVVGELEELVRDQPFREHLHEYLMIALSRLGRRVEALDAFHRVRTRLADELGVEPGPGLRQLHEAILRDEEVDLSPDREGPVTTASTPVPREVPPEVASFVGRRDALKAMDSLLSDDADAVAVGAVTGSAGVGKTALAVHWAHQVVDSFPDGQMYIDLRGYSASRPVRPVEALATLVVRLGVSPDNVPVDAAGAEAMFRSLTADKRLLLMLDNARSAAQVRPLLPGGRGCVVVVTSRDQLTGLVAQEGARRVALDVLAPEESAELLARVLGRERVTAEPEAAAALAAACAHLPLALRIAAADLAGGPYAMISAYLARLRREDPLAALAVEGDVAVRTAFDASYRALPAPSRRTFRRLGLVPCPDFTPEAAGALAGTGVSEAQRTLDTLAAGHLVMQHSPGRYTLHDLLRQFARARADTDDDEAGRADAIRRLLEHHLCAVSVAGRRINPEVSQLPEMADLTSDVVGLDSYAGALAWMDAERHNVVQSILHAARHGPRGMAWLLTDGMRGYFDLRMYTADWLTCARAALAAARSEADERAQATAFHGLAHVHFAAGHHNRAIAHLTRTIDLYGRLGDRQRKATLLSNLGMVLTHLGRPEEGIERLAEAEVLQHEHGLDENRAGVLLNLANALVTCGRLADALHRATQSLTWYRGLGDGQAAPKWEALAVATRGEVLHEMGRIDEAIQHFQQSLSLHDRSGSRAGRIDTLLSLALSLAAAHRLEQAHECAQTAGRMADEDGDLQRQAGARAAMAAVRLASGDHQGAIRTYQLALDAANRVGLAALILDTHLGLARAYHAEGEHDRATDHGEQALSLARRTQRRVGEARALTVLAGAHHGRGDHLRALSVGNEALEIHQQTGSLIGEADAHAVLGGVHGDLGHDDAAQDHQMRAQRLYAAVRSSSSP